MVNFLKQFACCLTGLLFVGFLETDRLPAQHLFDIERSTLYPVNRRPPVDWQVLETPHYSILHAHGDAVEARETGRILESQYAEARELVGGSLSDFPVLLTPYNDRSNGFVSPLNFRMEVDLHPIQGKALNPRSGNWLETVLPHELIHALHVNHHEPAGFSGVVQLFSPDLARSVHSAVPMGILEGLAVHHETRSGFSGGGRGNYPYFEGPFRATFRGNQRWSMGQMVQVPGYTRPFNRHYIGGYEFTRWLQDRYGRQTSREAIGFYSRYPFLGYGWALRHVTGQWPADLHNDFVRSTRKNMLAPAPSSSVQNSDSFQLISLPYEGTEVRRPLWLSDRTLLFHGSFYNARPGFYRYDLRRKQVDRLQETRLVEDYRYNLSRQRDTLLYARYHPHLYYDQQFTARIHKYPTDQSPTSDDSVLHDGFAPAFGRPGQLWSIENRGATTVLARRQSSSGSSDSVQYYRVDSTKFIAVQPHPGESDTLAIIANRRGVQGLWLSRTDRITETVAGPPDLAFKGGSVFDSRWHPSKNLLLLTSDHTGTMQIYEFDPRRQSVRQLTDHRHNAFEASYRPDGNQIAYVLQSGNEKRLALLKREDFLGKRVPESRWSAGSAIRNQLQRLVTGDSLRSASTNWPTHSYRTGLDWLQPRTILPYFNSETREIGMQLYSATTLVQQSYQAQFTYGRDELWYDLEYINTRTVPGFEVGLSRQQRLVPADNSISFIEHQQYEVTVPVPLTFEQNVRTTSLQVRPSLNYQLLRPFNPRSTPISGFSRYLTFQLESQFSYRLQQNLRDVQPNSGTYLIGEFRSDLGSWNAPMQRSGLRLGAYLFSSPLRRFNQSLRLGTEWITQTGPRLFNTDALGMPGFRPSLLTQSDHVFQLSSRYTVPLWHPDDGGFLIPLYLVRLYLVAFTRTVGDAHDFPLGQSRTIYGSGLRVTFRLSNLSIDLGIALTVEPTRGNYNGFVGTF